MDPESNAPPSPSLFEKLGVFYLGRHEPLAEQDAVGGPLLYDSRDLLTHAVCIGMTGSGKTGLGVGLIEEAAIDGIPSIVIDPKGDMGNLLLTFPGLSAEEFLPWVDADEAQRRQLSVEEYAAQQATMWREGLADWGQGGERIRALENAAEFSIYTPGSESGMPISVLASFAAPTQVALQDPDLLRERITTAVSSLLGLLAIDADPIKSREHILLANLIQQRWQQGLDAELEALIREIQTPPIERIGVMDIDTFYPPKERLDLAMQLNSLLASPSFQAWVRGQPLDVAKLLYTDEGRPRVAILSIAHLSEAERMFFVSLLLNEVVSWMRSQSGTTSLRALIYMDEIFGFMPPVAEPPSKRPLLTLLKQARAYGVGVVLATQNPVDLDYKGLSNAGTWFLGRLQTARDKERVLEGLEGLEGSAMTDRATLDKLLSGLGKRVFLQHNVHESGPSLFRTRWVMSYLRGPLTRSQISELTVGREESESEHVAEAAAPSTPSRPVESLQSASRPSVEPGVEELFEDGGGGAGSTAVYAPVLLGEARVRVIDRKTRVELVEEQVVISLPLTEDETDVEWSRAEGFPLSGVELAEQPVADATWRELPGDATRADRYKAWRKDLADFLYRDFKLELYHSPTFSMRSNPGESEAEFKLRLVAAARERRDDEVERMREKYRKKIVTLEDRLRRARARVEKEKQQASNAKLQSAISIGTTLLSLLSGRRRLSQTSLNRAGSAVRGIGRSSEQSQDVDVAEEAVEVLIEKLEDLNRELESQIDEIREQLDEQAQTLEVVAFRPRRSDVEVRRVVLLWTLA